MKFCRLYRPEKYEEFCKINHPEDYPVFLDLEDLLIHLEGSQMYRVLLETIRNQNIVTPFEKGLLACFIYTQLLRSHAIMNSSLEWNAEIGIDKFEYFVLLKWALSDKKFLYQQVGPIGLARWILYRTLVDTFPLTDSPILVNDNSVMVVLSPRLLLEILPQPVLDTISWDVKDEIDKNKFEEFQQRTIGNTFREIIFGSENLLEEWKQTKAFKQRVEIIKNMKGYNVLVSKEKRRELWHLNAFGNQNLQDKVSKRKRHRTRR